MIRKGHEGNARLYDRDTAVLVDRADTVHAPQVDHQIARGPRRRAAVGIVPPRRDWPQRYPMPGGEAHDRLDLRDGVRAYDRRRRNGFLIEKTIRVDMVRDVSGDPDAFVTDDRAEFGNDYRRKGRADVHA